MPDVSPRAVVEPTAQPPGECIIGPKNAIREHVTVYTGPHEAGIRTDHLPPYEHHELRDALHELFEE